MSSSMAKRLFAVLNRLIPKDSRRVVFCSFPDFSDNAQALYLYMMEHPMADRSTRFVWLADHPQDFSVQAGRVVKRRSIRGVWQYMRSKYIFHTHGLFGNTAVPGQMVVSLWHGMPLKTIMHLDKAHAGAPPFQFTYTLSTSPLFQDIMCRAFDCPAERCLITGLPRNDLLFSPLSLHQFFPQELPEWDRMVLWMPTYRKSVIGDIREDGNAQNAGMGFLTSEDWPRLNEHLARQRTLLFIKLHPMQDRTVFPDLDYPYIRTIREISAPLYSLVGCADALLTDYSSVYIDYLLLNRPIGFVTEDLDTYRDKRGFVFEDPHRVMPGPFIRSYAELTGFLDDLAAGVDRFREERENLTQRFHTFNDSNSCTRLLREIGWLL